MMSPHFWCAAFMPAAWTWPSWPSCPELLITLLILTVIRTYGLVSELVRWHRVTFWLLLRALFVASVSAVAAGGRESLAQGTTAQPAPWRAATSVQCLPA